MILTIPFLLLLVLGLVECELTDVVRTTKGPVQGEILSTIMNSVKYSSFKGIPYAEPPIGCNRFRPPIEKQEWSETLKANKEGSKCMQKDFVFRNLTGSEDCLYLNVYTPLTKLSGVSITLRPVMVWIHGGAFKAGYGNSFFYGPDFMIEEDVVLVTFNYRLGAFGFLSLDHPEATGNAGLKDQNLVLRWVQQNIKSFGGDPESVTLSGQSAGGASVDLHSLSHMSRGLFHRSISMSASPFCQWAFAPIETAVKRAFDLGSLLGPKTQNKDVLLKTLWEASAEDIVNLSGKLATIDSAFKPTLENPTIAPYEEKFMTQCPLNKYKNGDYYQVPHLMGTTSDEALLYMRTIKQGYHLWNYSFDTLYQYVSNIPKELHFHEEMMKITEQIKTGTLTTLIKETSNFLFFTGIMYKLKLMQEQNVHPIYFYRFNFDTEEAQHKLIYRNKLKGTSHSDDLPYLFYVSMIHPTLDPNHRISIVRKRMVRMWTNFAKFGNPTPHSERDSLLGINWPPIGNSNTHLEISDKLEVSNCSIVDEVEFYGTIMNLAAPVMSGCVPTSKLKGRF